VQQHEVDLDGTLWDATGASAAGWTRAAPSQGIDRELSAADIGSVCGLPFEACVDRLFPDLSEARRLALRPHLAPSEEAAVRELGGRLYDGVGEGLRALAERVPLDPLSNCHRWYLDLFLGQTGLTDVFRETLCHGDTGQGKASNLRRLFERHGSRAPVYVGDTPGDARACREAGCAFVFAADGFGEVEAPRFESFREVCAHLESRLA